jgi:maltooligosyltrehalose synthase
MVGHVPARRNRLYSSKVFDSAQLTLPPGAPNEWNNVLTGGVLSAGTGNLLRLSDLFAELPVALLVNK